MALINLNMLALPATTNMQNVPVGTVVAFMGKTIPTGWLLCDGSEVSRTVYAELFAQLDTVYGEGDGVLTFNLPNLVDGKFLEGATTAGAVHNAGLPDITGVLGHIMVAGNLANGAFARIESTGHTWDGAGLGDSYNFDFDASRSSTLYGASTTVQPYAMTVRFIIRATSQLTADETGFTIIYPNNGSREHPANVTSAQRYVMPNPFPGHYVHCVAEVLYNGCWGHTGGFVYNASNGYGHGVFATQYNDEDIVIQVGYLITANSEHCGNPFGIPGVGGNLYTNLQAAPCRVKVWRLNKIIQT